MSVTTTKWTLEDYHRMIEVGILSDRRVELLNGDIVDMVPQSPEHSQGNTDTADYLPGVIGNLALVRDAKPITLPETNSEPEPDLAIVQLLRPLYRTRHPYLENIFWLIEYAKTSLSKDLELKRQIYAAGIQEYWVVDLKNRVVTVFREPEGDDYRFQETLRNGEIRPLAFSEIRVSVQRLLEGI